MLNIINSSDIKTTVDHLEHDDTFHASLSGSDTCIYLRFWELDHYAVILGRNNKASLEVNETFCSQSNIPIIKRSSGGGTVLLGPGCLCYSLFIPTSHPQCSTISDTNCFVMDMHKKALLTQYPDIDVRGITDLAIHDVKVSGNAQRRKRDYILFHGTFLYSFDMSMISNTLQFPSRVPDYRKTRSHADFLTNVSISKDTIIKLISQIWQDDLSSR